MICWVRVSEGVRNSDGGQAGMLSRANPADTVNQTVSEIWHDSGMMGRNCKMGNCVPGRCQSRVHLVHVGSDAHRSQTVEIGDTGQLVALDYAHIQGDSHRIGA
jgi:hypothetical protein